MTFNIGEEVLYYGERYTVSIARLEEPYRFRLLRTTSDGAEVVWAQAGELEKIDSYTRPRDDTQQIHGSRRKRS